MWTRRPNPEPFMTPPIDHLPPAPGERISPEQLSDIAGSLLNVGGAHLTPEHLWGLHQEMLLGEGTVLTNDSPDNKRWILEVSTTEGVRVVLQDGTIQEGRPAGDWNQTAWEAHEELDTRRARLTGRSMIAQAGVGLFFRSTRPLTEQESEDLVEAMWGFSCHPYLGRRIVSDLNTHGRRAATVMPHLLGYMDAMQEEFRPFGVSVRRCWPMPSRGRPEVPEQERKVPMPRRIPKPR